MFKPDRNDRKLVAILLAGVLSALLPEVSLADPLLNWEVHPVLKGGRLDAVVSLGNGVVLAGARFPNSGRLFRSRDHGKTWSEIPTPLGTQRIEDCISCLSASPEGRVYMLTGNCWVWKSDDQGTHWKSLGRIGNNPNRKSFLHSYGLMVLDSGTVLVSDTNPEGGHVYRSEDGGETWEDIGPVSSDALYRFEKTGDGVLVNGWAGHLYKSIDDGRTWTDRGQLSPFPLYATENLGNGILLQGDESGTLYRSTDFGETWETVARLKGAADDFVHFGNGAVLYSTYTQPTSLYLSRDTGRTWVELGPVPNTVEGDVLDHVVALEDDYAPTAVGGTKQGFLVRIEILTP